MTDEHLSIGEVLTLLQDEFPDVTISKIRFLESQGLIDPERTPSGYRKFYGPDIDRLRWILTQQRENFLPLKVIRERLSNGDGAPDDEPADEPVSDGPLVEAADVNGSDAGAVVASDPSGAAGPIDPAATAAGDGAAAEAQPIWMADLAASKGAKTIRAAQALPLDAGPTEVSLTLDELIAGRPYGDDVYYDGDALLVATRAAAFFRHGIEVRHLRMFKISAEREAGFLEQVAMPMLKQRNPDARREAVELVEELADLGHDLRSALLRANLRRHLDRA